MGVYVNSPNVTLSSADYTLAGYIVNEVPNDFGKERTSHVNVTKPTTDYAKPSKPTTDYESVE